MTMTQSYARLLRRYAGDLDTQCMTSKAEATRQAARHMEELQAINDEAGEAVERLRVTLHHVESGLRAAEEERDELRAVNDRFAQRQAWWTDRMFALESDRDELLARLSALVDRCAYDGVPNDSLPVWQAAHDAVMRRKTPNVALSGACTASTK